EDENGKGQMTISMEAFYAYAAESDILIYNSAIADAPASIEELCRDQESFSDFKAVKEGMIWYTDKSLYQYTDRTGTIIEDLGEIILDGKEETEFFHKLR
ncbi:MAG: ABC transporter substrate-binding protein, partial [Lachnospiraceae bacterium]|nr:ABC transporter substrate-binding protein [Lachnospiraceae bacterium]